MPRGNNDNRPRIFKSKIEKNNAMSFGAYWAILSLLVHLPQYLWTSAKYLEPTNM